MSAPRVATANALGGEPKAFDGSMFLECLYAIVAAGWVVAAAARHPWRKDIFISFDEDDKQKTKNLLGAGHVVWLAFLVRG